MSASPKPLIAFHGDSAVKGKYLTRVQAHAEADELIQGTGWEDGKGCAVGCTLHRYEHAGFETELGIPEVLAYLQDGIFEGLTNGEAKAFPAQFLSAIQPGADLSLVWSRFAVWMLTNEKQGVIRFAHDFPAVKNAILLVSDLHTRRINNDPPPQSAWAAAWAAAGDAARAAAGAAAGAAAWDAARAAAGAAAWAAARDAAGDAAGAAAWAAARAAAGAAARDAARDAARAAAGAAAGAAARAAAGDAARRAQRDKLLELLASAPVFEETPA